jgi:hypothetical protein
MTAVEMERRAPAPSSESRQGTNPREMVRGKCRALGYGDYMSAGTVKPISRVPFTFIHSFVRLGEPILSSRPDLCRARRARSVKDGA